MHAEVTRLPVCLFTAALLTLGACRAFQPERATKLPSDLALPAPDSSYRAAVGRWMSKGQAAKKGSPERPEGWAAYSFTLAAGDDGDSEFSAFSGFRDLCAAFGGEAFWGNDFDGDAVWEWDWKRIESGKGRKISYMECNKRMHPVACPVEFHVVCFKAGAVFFAMALDERTAGSLVLEHYSSQDLQEAKQAADLREQERAALAADRAQKEAEQQAERNQQEAKQRDSEAASFRQNLQPGDRGSIPLNGGRKRALVVELKPPLVRVQTYNPPNEVWVPIESMDPPDRSDQP
jgi:hypothetical protein